MRILFALLLTAALGATACRERPAVPELIRDDYGVVQRINPDEKNVYLVFTGHFSTDDDGRFENFDGADDVLATLAEKGVKGSFFPTGNCLRAERYRGVIEQIIAQGHYLSAHSDKHLLLCSYEDREVNLVTRDSLARDIAGMEAELARFGLSKEQYRWMIPPYEYYNRFSADALRELGYTLVNPTEGLVTGMDWMGPGHPEYCSAAQLLDNIWDFEKEHSLNGAVILVHAMDYPDRTDQDRLYTHLGGIIDRLRELGYGFRTFNDVIAAERNPRAAP